MHIVQRSEEASYSSKVARDEGEAILAVDCYVEVAVFLSHGSLAARLATWQVELQKLSKSTTARLVSLDQGVAWLGH